ncbi:hypothetical protein N9L19_00965 [bacterium]|nr:hypothetical protein [bacterium]
MLSRRAQATVADALSILHLSSDNIIATLSVEGYTISSEERVVIPSFHGLGRERAHQLRHLRSSASTGRVELAARYLGPTLTHNGTNGLDILKRIQSAQSAWATLSAFWVAPVSGRLRKLPFRDCVHATLIKGLLPMLLTQGELKRLDTFLMGRLQSFAGDACAPPDSKASGSAACHLSSATYGYGLGSILPITSSYSSAFAGYSPSLPIP